MFLNFGGPGANGRESFETFGTIMQIMTDGCYDMIAIMPRYASPDIVLLSNTNGLL